VLDLVGVCAAFVKVSFKVRELTTWTILADERSRVISFALVDFVASGDMRLFYQVGFPVCKSAFLAKSADTYSPVLTNLSLLFLFVGWFISS